jgi:branched-chain amino acid transport system permease protein
MSRILLPLIILLALVLWPWAAPHPDLYFQVLGMTCFFASLALAWNIFALTGTISLGHAAFFGLGAYGAVLVERHLGLPVLPAVALGGLVGGGYGVIWAAALRNLRGAYFALASLAAMEIPKVIVDNWESLTAGSMGLSGISRLSSLSLGGWEVQAADAQATEYYLLLGLLCLMWLAHCGVLGSRWGWALRALRENESAAAMVGIDVFRNRGLALALSAALTGVCGGVYAHLIGQIEPALVFSLHLAAFPLVLSLFGGRFQAWGPVLGAFLLYPLDQLLLHPWFPRGHSAVYGLMIIVAVFCFPGGIASWLSRRLSRS